MNVLFICSRNRWRSPTAEVVWRQYSGVQVRSAGTSAQAKRRVTAADIQWSDVILVMEPKHRDQLRSQFRAVLQHKPVTVLHIPDDYQYLDPELVAIFETEAIAFLAAGSPDEAD